MPIVNKKKVMIEAPAASVQAVAPKLGTTKSVGKVPPVETEETGTPLVFLAPHATAGVKLGRRWSDGNYGSYAVEVWATVPCENTPEAMDKALNHAAVWADQKLQGLMGGNKKEG